MIALDSADSHLLEAWSRDGTMPNLAALRDRGAVGHLSAPLGITDDGLWASFQYATGLGGHGRYNYLVPLKDGRLGMAVNEEADRAAFWRRDELRGQRVAIIDVPKCAAPQAQNGIQIADWLVHGRSFPEPRSFPESLAPEIVARFGAAPPSRCSYDHPATTEVHAREVLGNLRRSVAMKRDAGMHYLGAEAWDLFVIAFKEAHCAGHSFWDLIDPTHSRYKPGQNAQLGEPMRKIFADLDAAIGDLVALAGTDADVIVFSTSNFSPNGTARHLMEQIVGRMNGHRLRRAVRRLLGLPARPFILLPYSDNCAALRINAGADKSRKFHLLNSAQQWLGELVDADTGAPVFPLFTRTASEETGPMAARLPDLLAHYRRNVTPRCVSSARLGSFTADIAPIRPGNHIPGGLVIAAGHAVQDAVCDLATFEDFGRLVARVLRPKPNARTEQTVRSQRL
jgi:hypothetical protein